MKKNFPLLWKVYDHIEAHPEEWVQKVWNIDFRELHHPDSLKKAWEESEGRTLCDTAFCFAGHTALIARPDISWLDRNGYYASTVWIHGRMLRMSDIATKELGLTVEEADVLFDGGNSLADIKRHISDWEAEELSI